MRRVCREEKLHSSAGEPQLPACTSLLMKLKKAGSFLEKPLGSS